MESSSTRPKRQVSFFYLYNLTRFFDSLCFIVIKLRSTDQCQYTDKNTRIGSTNLPTWNVKLKPRAWILPSPWNVNPLQPKMPTTLVPLPPSTSPNSSTCPATWRPQDQHLVSPIWRLLLCSRVSRFRCSLNSLFRFSRRIDRPCWMISSNGNLWNLRVRPSNCLSMSS